MNDNPYQSPQTEPDAPSTASKSSMLTGYLAAVLAFVGQFMLGTAMVTGGAFLLARRQFSEHQPWVVLLGMLVGTLMGAYSAHSAIRAYRSRNARLERIAQQRRRALRVE